MTTVSLMVNTKIIALPILILIIISKVKPVLNENLHCAGAIGAEWLKAFKGYIENPESMLL